LSVHGPATRTASRISSMTWIAISMKNRALSSILIRYLPSSVDGDTLRHRLGNEITHQMLMKYLVFIMTDLKMIMMS